MNEEINTEVTIGTDAYIVYYEPIYEIKEFTHHVHRGGDIVEDSFEDEALTGVNITKIGACKVWDKKYEDVDIASIPADRLDEIRKLVLIQEKIS